MDYLLQLDGNILLFIQDNIRNEFLNPIIIFITHLGDKGILWILLCLALICIKKTRRIGICCFIALVASFIVNNVILKNLVARVRPYEVVNGLERLIEKQSDASFPSGHSASSFAVAVTMIGLAPKKMGIPAIIMASLIALSRLYVGVHYPSDVLVGIISGSFFALMTILINKQLEKKKSQELG